MKTKINILERFNKGESLKKYYWIKCRQDKGKDGGKLQFPG